MDKIEYKGYYGSVEYSKENNCLLGKVLGMSKDVITYEGQTMEELQNDFEAGIDSYLEGCRELGIKPRKSLRLAARRGSPSSLQPSLQRRGGGKEGS